MTILLPPKLTEAEQQAICDEYPYAAMHQPKHSVHQQLYLVFDCNRQINDQIHKGFAMLPDYKNAPPLLLEIEKSKLVQLQIRTRNRTNGHKKQCWITDKLTYFREHFYLARLYKFDLTETEKMEITVPRGHEELFKTKMEMVSEMLLCMKAILPQGHGVNTRFPSTYHDINFSLIRDFVNA